VYFTLLLSVWTPRPSDRRALGALEFLPGLVIGALFGACSFGGGAHVTSFFWSQVLLAAGELPPLSNKPCSDCASNFQGGAASFFERFPPGLPSFQVQLSISFSQPSRPVSNGFSRVDRGGSLWKTWFTFVFNAIRCLGVGSGVPLRRLDLVLTRQAPLTRSPYPVVFLQFLPTPLFVLIRGRYRCVRCDGLTKRQVPSLKLFYPSWQVRESLLDLVHFSF